MGQKNSCRHKNLISRKNLFLKCYCCFYCCSHVVIIVVALFLVVFVVFFQAVFLVVIVVQAATKVGTFAAQLQAAVCYLFYFRDIIDSGAFFGIKNAICKQIKRNTILSIIHLLLVRFERNLLCIIATCVEKVSCLYFH